MQWTRGSPGIINLPVSSKICEIMDPYGVIVTSKIGECYHEVKVVTAAHEGVWRVRYNMNGMLDPVEQKFRVETLGKAFMREYFRFQQKVTRFQHEVHLETL